MTSTFRFDKTMLKSLCRNTNITNVEIHLSYSDLSLDLEKFNWDVISGDFLFLTELFENDHILDLASDEDGARKQSIKNLKRVVEYAVKARSHKQSRKTSIVVQRWRRLIFPTVADYREDKESNYEQVADAISSLVAVDDVDLQKFACKDYTVPVALWRASSFTICLYVLRKFLGSVQSMDGVYA